MKFYTLHAELTFSGLAAVYSQEQSESVLVFFQSYLLNIVGLQKPGELHNAVVLCFL